MDQIETGHHLEQLTRHMVRGAYPSGRQADLARVGLGMGDELGDGLSRKRRIHDYVGNTHDVR
jgi:hypothetical protein